MAKVLKKKVLKVVDVVEKKTAEDYVSLVRELRTINLQMGELKKRDEELKKKINPYIDKTFTADGKGNRFFETTDSLGERLVIKREVRKSRKLVEDKVRTKCEQLGLTDRVFSEVTITKMDETEIENLVAEELLTLEDVEFMSEEKVTYATVFVKEKEEEEVPEE